MKIKEIIIENFRSYYEVNPIKLKDGLTLIIGDNGDGKTTFFEALEWLFKTSTNDVNSRYISQKKKRLLLPNETAKVRVAMTFDHDGEKTVEKSFLFTKKDDDSIEMSGFEFIGYDGTGSERLQQLGKHLLDRCFDAKIRRYCLFKGESELNVFSDEKALNLMVDFFSDVKEFDPYLSFAEYAESSSQRALENAMKADKNNEKEEKRLSAEIAETQRKLTEVTTDLKNRRKEATDYTLLLENLEKNKEASEMLKDINDRLQNLSDKKIKTQARIDENYTTKLLDEMWILCGFKPIFQQFQEKVAQSRKEKSKIELLESKKKGKIEAIQEISKQIAEGITPLPLYIPDRKTMEDMIEDEFCKVCNRKAEKGSEAYKFMVSKLKEYLKSIEPKNEPEEEKLFSYDYIRELHTKSIHLEFSDEINNLLVTIQEVVDFNARMKNELLKINDSIEAEEINKKKLLAQTDGLDEAQLIDAYQNISNWWSRKSDAEKQIPILEGRESRITSDLEELKNKYSQLAENSTASMYAKVHTALNKILKAFVKAKKQNTLDFLEQLENKSNEYLSKLNIEDFRGVIRLIQMHDETAKIQLFDSRGERVYDPNTALETTMYMSVLFAVSELTKIKRENDFPLIFDAPTSSLSPAKESNFFTVISNIQKQCIIITKSFFVEDPITKKNVLNLDQINALHGAVYRIEKKRPFDEQDLSTIQTTITPIK